MDSDEEDMKKINSKQYGEASESEGSDDVDMESGEGEMSE